MFEDKRYLNPDTFVREISVLVHTEYVFKLFCRVLFIFISLIKIRELITDRILLHVPISFLSSTFCLTRARYTNKEGGGRGK